MQSTLLFETKDFALEIKHLPEVSSSYTLDMLKVDLWQEIQQKIMSKP